MKKVILVVALLLSGQAFATGGAHQLVGSILVTNPGASRTVGQWNIEYNHRHPSYAACEAAKQMIMDQEITVDPDILMPHYGVTNGKINKVAHLSCVPVAAAFE